MTDLRAAIEEEQTNDIEVVKIYDIVEVALAKFEGKPISKRFETAVRKACPDLVVYYDHMYSMFHLRIWNFPLHEGYNKAMQLLLGYDSRNIFTMADFRDKNAGYGSAAKERIAQRAELLKYNWCEVMSAKIDRYIALGKDIEKEAEYPNPAYYIVSQYLKR